ncbi:MAG: DUF1015 domain-containing protein [Candidatus Bipolaricaulota bacterium]
MAEVYPFQGYRYNPEKVGDVNRVVSPPYDKIEEEEREDLANNSLYNVVRIILSKAKDEGEDKYERAAKNFQDWIDEGALQRDEEPAFYAYYQKYEAEGEKKVRKGFIGLGKIEEGEGVKAHEETMSGPKADRLRLLKATEANFGQIFMLYSDPENEVTEVMDRAKGEKPVLEVKDKYRNTHKLWQLTDEEIKEQIREKMKDKSLYIADGHHRYETALNYRNECREKGWESPESGGFDTRMMTFVNVDDPGLSILATHRLLHDLKNFRPHGVLDKAREHFSIARYDEREDLLEKLDADRGKKHTFGYRAKDDKAYWSLTLRDESIMAELLPEKSEAWRGLDVAILHKLVLENYLGIDEEALEEKRNLEYVRGREKALDMLKEGKYQGAFIMNPTRIDQVKEVADRGEKMPQKSTDFYPKLLTGPVLHKLTIDKG